MSRTYNQRYTSARTRAVRALIDGHKDEYVTLLQTYLGKEGIKTRAQKARERKVRKLQADTEEHFGLVPGELADSDVPLNAAEANAIYRKLEALEH